MNFYDKSVLETMTGAVGVVWLFVAVMKSIFPAIDGRKTHLFALAVSLVAAFLVGSWGKPESAFISLANGLLIYVAAVGVDTNVFYKKSDSQTPTLMSSSPRTSFETLAVQTSTPKVTPTPEPEDGTDG